MIRPLALLLVAASLRTCVPPTAYMDAYSASQGYYAPAVVAPPVRTVCYRVVNQLVCETR